MFSTKKVSITHAEAAPTATLDNIENESRGLIFGFLDNKSTENLKQVSKTNAAFFSKRFLPTYVGRKLLKYFSYGQRQKAGALLEQCAENPNFLKKVLMVREAFKDCGQRTFRASAWEYALWARDRFSWELLLPYLIRAGLEKMAWEQKKDLDKKGLTYTIQQKDPESNREIVTALTSSQYDFNGLIQPLTLYRDHFPGLWAIRAIDLLNMLWSQYVGPAQGRTVAHIWQEYCRPERSFNDPNLSFNEAAIQDEAFIYDWTTYNSAPVNALSDEGAEGLGAQFAVVRGFAQQAVLRSVELADQFPTPMGCSVDVAALTMLSEVRARDYVALEARLYEALQRRLAMSDLEAQQSGAVAGCKRKLSLLSK